MKLLCSILILAGVFALNDASMTNEDEMRVARDKLILEDLKQTTANRDTNSIECSQKLLKKLTAILEVYDAEVSACNQTKEESIASLYEAADIKLKQFSDKLATECESLNKCESFNSPVDSLDCFEGESSLSAKILTSVSNEAATDKIELLTGIETAIGNEDVCKTVCYGKYSDASDSAQSDFNDCTNKKPSDGGGDGGKKTTTEAPKEPEDPSDVSTPSGEEQQEEPQSDGKRAYRANKFRRS